ncbi:uncharacterized protein B0H18DRAFT_272061, partial [Fomitopsis serialis]|uniref:uncharacterized protein n=1 Tax=Fomitopsis serialis TaxID=139415 RepID=UPI00200760A9
MSSGDACGLYGLRLMHRLNISLSASALGLGRPFFMLLRCPNPNPVIQCLYTKLCILMTYECDDVLTYC